MNPLAAVLSQDWTGELLFAARGLFLPPHPGSSRPRLTAVALQLGERSLVIGCDAEELTIRISTGPLPAEAGPQADLSPREPFRRFLHCPLYSWWLLENEFGSHDGVVLAFDRLDGLLLLAGPEELDAVTFTRPVG
jgi:hypothetical protein